MSYNDLFDNQTSRYNFYHIFPRAFDKDLNSSTALNISHITSSNGIAINFSSPVVFMLEHDEDGHYASNTVLNIYAYGKNSLELRDDIVDEIIRQWNLYANEDDDCMTADAQAIKYNLRKMVVLKESTVSYA